MAKLTRFTMPVFAGNAAQTQTSVFGTMKTSPQYTSDVAASIGTTAYGNGWADAIEIGYAPYLEDMNTLQKAITYQISYGQQQGIPEWASDTEYYIGSLTKLNTANGSQIYSSLVDNNVGNLLSDTTKWKLLLDTTNTYVTTNTEQTITGSKTFTSPINSELPLGTYYSVQTKKKGETKGTAPSRESLVNGIGFYDKDGKMMGAVKHVYNTSKNSIVTIQANKANSSSDTSIVELNLVYPADGTTPYAEAPNSDTSGIAKIVTTISKYKDGTGHYKFGNGLIINWGRKTYASPDPQVATFHEQFTSPYYKVVATYYYNGQVSSSRDHITITEQNKNNFKFYMSDTAGYAVNWIAIGY